jgi:hypothetical protein
MPQVEGGYQASQLFPEPYKHKYGSDSEVKLKYGINLHKSHKVDKIGDTENQKVIYIFCNTCLSNLFQSLFHQFKWPHKYLIEFYK